MKKNISGQKIGAQLVSATDGSAFTGSVTVYVTGDAGTQAAGSVGSGACTHEGNGYHTYAPAQAETNYDLVAFTFVGTGAVPVTIQIYTNTPQTGDSYAIVNSGTHGNAALKTLIDTIDDFLDTEIAAILADTNELQTDWVNGGRLDLLIDAIKAKTDNLPADPADASDIAALIDALPTANENADALLDRASGVETGYTPRQALRLILAALAAKLSGAATTTVVIRDIGDSKDRITATVDANGNRTAVTVDAT